LENISEGDFYLVDLEYHESKQKLLVFVDNDTGITLRECQLISRRLEEAIDDQEFFPKAYTLDVSSPGIDRPLRLYRQYLKNIGRPVQVFLKDGSILSGVLTGIDDNEVRLEAEKKKGKKQKTEGGDWNIPFDDIDKIVVEVRFKKLKK